MSNGLALYRWFNKEHELLYVGISSSLSSRVKAHSKMSKWFIESAYMTIEWANTTEDLANKERLAIRKERPIHNISHNVKPQRKAFSTPVSQREIILLATLETLKAKNDEAEARIALLELQVREAKALKELFELQTERAKLIYDAKKIERLFITCNH